MLLVAVRKVERNRSRRMLVEVDHTYLVERLDRGHSERCDSRSDWSVERSVRAGGEGRGTGRIC